MKDIPMNDAGETPKPGWMRRLPLLAILAVAVTGAFTLRDYISFETLAEHHEALIAFRDAHYLWTALGFMAVYIAIVGFSLPGATIATLTGGFLFGLFPGVLFNVTAATIGATAIFLAARLGMGERLAARMDAGSGLIRHLKDGIRENELSVLFLIRLVPVVPFFVANLLPALVGVTVARFVLTTFLGIIPGGVVYTWVGAGLGAVFARGETPDLGLIFDPYILGPILGLCALAALPIVLKALRRRKDI
ncbi:TVP38/TMEM64 family protein [Actibacterium sp. D379-3]